MVFMDRIEIKQQDLQAVKEAYDELRIKHTELSSRSKMQQQQMRDSSQSLSVHTQILPTFEEEVRAEEPHNELTSSSELPGLGSLHSVSSQARNPGRLEDTGAVTKPVVTGRTGGQGDLKNHQQSPFEQPLNTFDLFAGPLISNNLCCRDSRLGTDNNTNSLNKVTYNSNVPGNDCDVVSDLIYSTSSVSDNNHLTSEGKRVNTTTLSSPDQGGHVGLPGKDEGRDMNAIQHGGEDDLKQEQNNSKLEERNKEQQWKREDVLNRYLQESGSNGLKNRLNEATDKADRREENKGSAEDAGDTRNQQTETRDRAEGEGTDGLEERGKTALHTSETPETQIRAQTTADTTIEKSNTRQVVDFMDAELPLAVSDPSDISQSLPPKVIENDAHFSPVKKRREIGKAQQFLHTLNSDDGQSMSEGLKPVIQDIQKLPYSEVQTEDTVPFNQLPCRIAQISEKTIEEPFQKSGADFLTKPSRLLNPLQTNAAPLATPKEAFVSRQEFKTNTAQTSASILPEGKQMDERSDTHGSEECLVAKTLVESQSLPPNWKQKSGQGKSLETDGHDGNASACKKSEAQLNVHTQVKCCETVQDPVEKYNLKYACLNLTMDTADFEFEVKSGSCRDLIENAKIEETGDAKTIKSKVDLSLHSSECLGSGCSDRPEQLQTKEMLLDNTDKSLLPSKKTYRSSFDWRRAQRQTASSRAQSDVLMLPQFVEGTEQTTGWSGRNYGPSTKSMFLTSRHNKGDGFPLVISRASDLLNASSVSGTPASLKREWDAAGETFGETVRRDTESRVSVSISSFPGLPHVRHPQGKCSRDYTSAAAHISESGWEASSSQETEEQQSSFRAQISKIEQFLNAERLSLPKRQRTDS
ncbi:hypothetical protein Q5P01_012054 [Channa striata]|uniref:Uncharacterized protein n=1 Tax=Channa striata TaxID=64152 RepID=A0AA88SQN8_CHASR|nr:hypothetical protein Q5P01_012054 [Channa striata]